MTAAPTAPASGRTLCGCGCGAAVARRFAPGHDARLKGRLQRAALEGGRSGERAAWALIDAGWGRWLDPTTAQALPRRDSAGRAKRRIDIQPSRTEPRFTDAGGRPVWHVEPGRHDSSEVHAHLLCNRLRAAARRAGQITRWGTIRGGWLTTRSERPTGFEDCPECCTTGTPLDDIAHETITDALQAEARSAAFRGECEVHFIEDPIRTYPPDPSPDRLPTDWTPGFDPSYSLPIPA